jgi:excisionase family DNA binding protein
MQEPVKKEKMLTPMLFPYTPDDFWQKLREVVREEIVDICKRSVDPSLETSGLTQKPLFKLSEVCAIFQISRPTLYEWIREGRLTPFKIRSRVFFLRKDIDRLMEG